MKMKTFRAPLAAAAALLLAACASVGPDYQRPALKLPTAFRELPGWAPAQPAAEGPKGEWWRGFHDPLLDELEPLVAVSNQTVRQSYASYQQALAELKIARGTLVPTLGLNASGSRQRSAGGSASALAGAPLVNNSGTLEGSLSWAPDLWGSVRRSIEQSTASAQASQATLANATLSAQLALATAVIELRTSDANMDLLQQTVEAYQRYLAVVADKDRFGTSAPSDLVGARTQLETAQASLIALGVARAQYAHAIAVLVGKNPEELEIPHSSGLPSLPAIPLVLPSTLLQRRPDIETAERQMAAQNAAIGVASAAYYPSVSLSSLAGFTQSPLGGLLKASNYVWSLGGSASETLFDGGQRSGQVEAAQAAYDAAVANYRGTVLSALQQVENDLSGLRILTEQAHALEAAVRDATRGAEIARDQYQAGTVDYTTVATAQATQLSNQQSALNVQQSLLLSAASLIGDLGGGWTERELAAP